MKRETKSKGNLRVRAISVQSDEHAVWLVLSEPRDESAEWLARGLPAQTGHAVLHMTSRDVNNATRADRGADDEGEWFSMTTNDGRTLHSRRVAGVVNRLGSPFSSNSGSVGHLQGADGLGSAASLESWLQDWSGVVLNRPMAESPGSDLLPSYWWVERALTAGFLGPDEGPSPNELPEASFRTVVIGDEVFSAEPPGRAVPEALGLRCLRMARAAWVSIVGIDAARTEAGGWRFLSAKLRPDLRDCGEGGIRAVAKALARKPLPEQAASFDS